MFALVALVVLLAQTLTRRSAALVVLALMVAAGAAGAQRPAPGNRLLARGDTARARQAFAADVKSQPSDTAWFNAGTSALVAGDLAAGRRCIAARLTEPRPGFAPAGLYNLGTAYLLQARRDTAQRDTLLSAASSRLQQALLLAPGDRNAKFNYELARHLRPPPKHVLERRQARRMPRRQPPPPPSSGGRAGMTPAEADQVLSAMERAERDTRQRQQQRVRPGEPPPGPDW